jgi:hypothetical protein
MAYTISQRLAPALFSAALMAACSGGHSGSDSDDGGSGSAPPPAAPSFEQSSDDAYTYLLPLYEMSSTRKAALDTAVQSPNTFVNVPTLADAKSHAVTTPNVDTLYSSAFLLLADGPVQIDIPDSGDRYFSLSILDFYTNNIAVQGTRVDGGAAKSFWVVGPQWSGTAPTGITVIHSPTNSAWALGRTYVRDQADVHDADAVQSQLKATATASSTTTPASLSTTVPAATDWEAFFTYADQLMVENPVATGSAATALTQLGLGNGTFNAAALTSTQKTDLETGASAAYQRAISAAQGIAAQQGWVYPAADLGNFGEDYTYRASIAVSGLGALPTQETIYIDGAGDAATPQRYDGTHNYSLTFPAGTLPPNSAFWSLTLYQPDSDGSLFLYDNSQNRYAIGSNTAGVTYGSDGSLTLQIQNADPAPGSVDANWLPAPAGPFALILRVYLPGSGLLDGSYRLPAVVQQ